MTTLPDVLTRLADTNYRGAVFLLAYGVTWVLCGVAWQRLRPRTSTFVTLFQGMLALPVALGASAVLGMFDRSPGEAMITQLGVLIAMSQLLVLPLLIVLTAKQFYTLVPLCFAASSAIHFVPYAWLYQTPLYIVMPVVLAIGLAVVAATSMSTDRSDILSTVGASRVCFLTGLLLLITGGAAILTSL